MPATDTRDRIISFVKSQGPVLPYQISKIINENIIIASAYLSELVSSGILRISSLKVGGSPLYYAPGQEHQLQKYSGNMHEKEKKAYDLLQQKKILEDTSLEPVIRVALRDIKDFAVPIKVNHDNRVYLFWKWYLTPNEEAQNKMKDHITSYSVIQEKAILQSTLSPEPIQPTQQEITQQKQEIKPIQEQIKEQKESIKKLTEIAKDNLYNNIIEFFKKNKINVLSYEIIKKNSEMDFVVEIPSPLGSLTYYCKTKSKKRISDSDLKSAYVSGQLKKLPVVFVAKSELSKKAEEILKELKGLTFVKL